MRTPELFFDFPARFELRLLDRVDTSFSERVFGYPGARRAAPGAERDDDTVVGVRDHRGQAWIGVFSTGSPEWSSAPLERVVAMPDCLSFCVVRRGGGTIVRSDDPTAETELELEPIVATLAVPERSLLVVAGAYRVVAAYGLDGLEWEQEPMTDDVELLGVEGDTVVVGGFLNGRRNARVALDLATGEPR